VFFQADYDKIELQKISYGVILVISSPLRYRKTSPKQRHKNLTQSKFLATPVFKCVALSVLKPLTKVSNHCKNNGPYSYTPALIKKKNCWMKKLFYRKNKVAKNWIKAAKFMVKYFQLTLTSRNFKSPCSVISAVHVIMADQNKVRIASVSCNIAWPPNCLSHVLNVNSIDWGRTMRTGYL